MLGTLFMAEERKALVMQSVCLGFSSGEPWLRNERHGSWSPTLFTRGSAQTPIYSRLL